MTRTHQVTMIVGALIVAALGTNIRSALGEEPRGTPKFWHVLARVVSYQPANPTVDTAVYEEAPILQDRPDQADDAYRQAFESALARIQSEDNGQPPATRAKPVAEQRTSKAKRRLQLHPSLGNARFGMTPDEVRQRYEVSWFRKQSGELMLASNFDVRGIESAQFHFRSRGLYKMALCIRPPDQRAVSHLKKTMAAQLARVYKGMETSNSHWNDGKVYASLSTAKGSVTITYCMPDLENAVD